MGTIPVSKQIAGCGISQSSYPGISFEIDRRWDWVRFLLMRVLTAWVATKKRVYAFFNSQPLTNTLWVDGLGKASRKVKEGAASWRALDLLYNHPFAKPVRFSDAVDNFWMATANAQAVRNRRKIATAEIIQAVLNQGKAQVKLFAIAAGSAQSEIEAIAELKKRGVNVECLMIDLEQDACDYAVQMSRQSGVADQFKALQCKVGDKQFLRLLREFKPDVVEMLGLLDYLTNDYAVSFIGKIRKTLPVRGVFLTCNICPNREREFLKQVVNWRDMHYRTPTELYELVAQAGFSAINNIVEPHKIHAVVVATKTEW